MHGSTLDADDGQPIAHTANHLVRRRTLLQIIQKGAQERCLRIAIARGALVIFVRTDSASSGLFQDLGEQLDRSLPTLRCRGVEVIVIGAAAVHDLQGGTHVFSGMTAWVRPVCS